MARPAGHEMNRQAWRDVLRLSGLSLTEVAEIAGVARPTLSAITRGFNRASTPTAHKIARAVGFHPATLFPTLGQPEEQ